MWPLIVLGCNGELASIETATCQCAAGKSASCTHVSGLLHALVSISESELQFLVPGKDQQTEEDEETLPITSYACQWKIPKKRKEATLPFAEATFTKHVYGKEKKRTLKPLEQFDPRPDELKGTANSALPELLNKLRGKGLSISLSLDSKTRFWKRDDTTTSAPTESEHPPTLPSKLELQRLVIEFKKSLHLPHDKIRDIEQHTRHQSQSSLWYSVRRCRLTASYFGLIRQRRPTTSPHSLVLRILGASSFSSPATDWGKDNEQIAIEQYVQQQKQNGKTDMYACPSGFVISEVHPFLGASPDSVVYDPSVINTFGLVEIKCPYSSRDMTPVEACSQSTFFCTLNSTTVEPQLKKEHPYYSQVQGQMAITKREWCDFVVYTKKGISIERINFNKIFWEELLHKLIDFYDNCLAPEIVNPIHVL